MHGATVRFIINVYIYIHIYIYTLIIYIYRHTENNILKWAHQQSNGRLHVVNCKPEQPTGKFAHTCQHKWYIPTSMEREISAL